jgi:type VI protein secretion system component VasF
MTEFNADVCKSRYDLCATKHGDVERRISQLEHALKDSEEKQEERLARIHTRFDEVSQEMMRRLPGWATILIGLLTAGVAGLAVAAIK